MRANIKSYGVCKEYSVARPILQSHFASNHPVICRPQDTQIYTHCKMNNSLIENKIHHEAESISKKYLYGNWRL